MRKLLFGMGTCPHKGFHSALQHRFLIKELLAGLNHFVCFSGDSDLHPAACRFGAKRRVASAGGPTPTKIMHNNMIWLAWEAASSSSFDFKVLNTRVINPVFLIVAPEICDAIVRK